MNKLYVILTVAFFCLFHSISTETRKELLSKTDLAAVITQSIANISEDALRKYLESNKEAFRRFGGKLELLAEKILEQADIEDEEPQEKELKKPLKIHIDPEKDEEVSPDPDRRKN